MNIGIGVWAFIVYISFIIIWNVVVKRHIAEAMAIGLLIASAFNGVNMPMVLLRSFVGAMQSDIILAILLFLIMSTIMSKTGIFQRLVNILDSILGRVRGGPGYVASCASTLFGLASGSGTGNAATVGTITVPWLIQTGWPKEVAATMNSGNAGLGICLPASSSMLLMLGSATVAQHVGASDLYIPLLCGGLWALLYRMILVRYYVWKYKIPALPPDQIDSLKVSLQKGGSSLFLLLGILVPLSLIIGPLANALTSTESFGSTGSGAINIIIWVPVLITLICLIEGREMLPKSLPQWKELIISVQKTCVPSGAAGIFALAGSVALTSAGFGTDLQILLESMNMPPLMMIIAVGIIVVLVAGPLSATATTVGLGPVAFTAMVGVGVNPVAAVVAFLIFVSTEGASPPSAAPILISCGIADVEDISVTFKPMILHYVIPTLIIASLIAMGILPIINA